MVLAGQAEEGLEGGHGCLAAVVTEDELVELVWQVLGADAVMGF